MQQITGFKRKRDGWYQFMEQVDEDRAEIDPDDGDDPDDWDALREQARTQWRMRVADLLNENDYGGFRHLNPVEMRENYNETLDLVAFHHIRVLWQRFILNIRKFIGYRRSNHGLHSASILGAW